LISLKISAKAKSVHECDVSCRVKLPSSEKHKPLCHKNKLECGHSFEFCVKLQPSFLILGVMEMHFAILDTITIRLVKISVASQYISLLYRFLIYFCSRGIYKNRCLLQHVMLVLQLSPLYVLICIMVCFNGVLN